MPPPPCSEVFGLQRFRECELIHGRWAMLACLGALVQEGVTGDSWVAAQTLVSRSLPLYCGRLVRWRCGTGSRAALASALQSGCLAILNRWQMHACSGVTIACQRATIRHTAGHACLCRLAAEACLPTCATPRPAATAGVQPAAVCGH